jgi:signal transduction histidine kinase/DNA-binding response OmpR family regulator/HPt (histidine-containing phosphotransfer) domain-containing protein/HAMP domain-containing protein
VAPLLRDGAFLGALALQVDLGRLEPVVADRTGLGRTGETVLAQREGDEVLYTAPLRHVPDAAYRHRLPLDQVSWAMRQALTGVAGEAIAADYAGNEVVEAIRYLPALGWGMVVKIDTAEALAPAERVRRIAYAGLGLLLALSGIVAYLFGQHLAAPILQLTASAERISQGDLDHRAPSDGFGEIGRLAEAFNRMTESLVEARQDLEAKVQARTAELHTSEARLLEAQQLAQVGNWELDLVSGKLRWSEEIFRLFEIDPRRFDASYEAFLNAIHPDDRDRVNQAYTDSVASHTAYEIAHRLRMPDGRIKWVNERCQTDYDAQGKPIRSSGTVQDISQLKRIEAALVDAMQLAESASRAKSAFLANMSHEIRTPMNAILGMVRLLQDTGPTSQQRDYLAKVSAAAKALLGILNDILDYSKIEAGRMDIECIPMRLEEILQGTADLFGAQIEQKGLELFLDLDPGLPPVVLGDPLRLSQVLNNLLSNAVKFTSRGEIHLKVEPAGGVAGPLTLRFSVRDTGIGLSREQADRLFLPFTQGDESITRKYGGTGLGLSICRKLVELMGGELAVSSAEGQGSTFTFTLQVGRAVGVTADLQHLEGARVLVVDDQETSRRILQELLRAWGVEARAAGSGREALAEIQAAEAEGRPFAAVLLDWGMPGLDPMEVVERLGRLAQPQAGAALLVMASRHQEDEVRAKIPSPRLGGFVAKPVVPSGLFNALLAALGSGIPAPSAAPAAAAAVTRFAGGRILVAEDNITNQEVATAFLRGQGLEVAVAGDGHEVLEQLQIHAFDAVLMDLHMPGMDGLEATRRIREQPALRGLPVIAMTAAVLAEDRARCIGAGMNDFVAKPIDPEELHRCLRKWLPNLATAPALSESPSASPLPNPPGFDLAAALQRLNGDAGLLVRLLRGFALEHAGTMDRLDALVREDRAAEAAAMLHALKGAAANLGAVDLAAAARRTEQELKSGQQPGSLAALATALDQAIAAIAALPDPRSAQAPTGREAEPLAALLEALVPYLKQQELVPEELLHGLQGLAEAEPSGRRLARLLEQIDRFDHEGALASIARIVETLRPEPQP